MTNNFVYGKTDNMYVAFLQNHSNENYKLWDIDLFWYIHIEIYVNYIELHSLTEAATRSVLYKKCLENFAGLIPATLLKKRLRHRCFPEKFVKFLRTPFFKRCVRYFLSNFYFSPNGSPLKTMKNVFYFI